MDPEAVQQLMREGEVLARVGCMRLGQDCVGRYAEFLGTLGVVHCLAAGKDLDGARRVGARKDDQREAARVPQLGGMFGNADVVLPSPMAMSVFRGSWCNW